MPTYDYACRSCLWRGDLSVSVSERHAAHCPHCSGPLNLLIPASAPAGRVGLVSRSRYARDRGLLELGDAKLDEVAKEFDRYEREAEEANTRQIEKVSDELAQEFGEVGEAVVDQSVPNERTDTPVVVEGGWK